MDLIIDGGIECLRILNESIFEQDAVSLSFPNNSKGARLSFGIITSHDNTTIKKVIKKDNILMIPYEIWKFRRRITKTNIVYFDKSFEEDLKNQLLEEYGSKFYNIWERIKSFSEYEEPSNI